MSTDAVPPSASEKKWLVDAVLRTVTSMVVGVMGFWYPLWTDRGNDPSADSRIGMLVLGTLPIIVGVAIWATIGIVTRGPMVLGSRRGLGLGFIVGAIAACWSPVLYVAFGILWSMVS